MTPQTLPPGILLRAGAHKRDQRPTALAPDTAACVMEAVSWLAGEPWSDRPACACPVWSEFFRGLNDAPWTSDKERTEALAPAIPLLVGSRTDAAGEQRRRAALAHLAASVWVPRAMFAAVCALEVRGFDASALRAAALAVCDQPRSKILLSAARDSLKAVGAYTRASASARFSVSAACVVALAVDPGRAAADAVAHAACAADAYAYDGAAADDGSYASGTVLRLCADEAIALIRADRGEG